MPFFLDKCFRFRQGNNDTLIYYNTFVIVPDSPDLDITLYAKFTLLMLYNNNVSLASQ